jgi:hypothetical protein
MKERIVFNNYSQYLKTKYNTQVYRVSVDAGFSCPHRGLDRSRPGCTFCDNQGARAPYLGDENNVKSQIEGGIQFLKKRYNAKDFLLYFQAFSNTFAPIETLKNIYDTALQVYPFKELIISTRPDCINEAIARLLATYKQPDREVWLELGLQSGHDMTLQRINRGHGVADFLKAYRFLKAKELKITIHLIFGLPGEDWPEIEETIRFVAGLKPDGIKIHNLHIPFQSEMYVEYLQGELTAPLSDKHLQWVIQALERLPPHTVVMRLTCDTVTDQLAAPRRFLSKGAFYDALRHEMRKQNTWQGRLYHDSL